MKEKLKEIYSKQKSEYFDPCQEAADRSIRCLTRNSKEDKDFCSDYFQYTPPPPNPPPPPVVVRKGSDLIWC